MLSIHGHSAPFHMWARKGSWNHLHRHFFMTRVEVGEKDCSHADASSHLYADVPGHLHYPRHPLLQRPGKPARRRGWRWECTCSHEANDHHSVVSKHWPFEFVTGYTMASNVVWAPAGSCLTRAHGQDLGQRLDEFRHF